MNVKAWLPWVSYEELNAEEKKMRKRIARGWGSLFAFFGGCAAAGTAVGVMVLMTPAMLGITGLATWPLWLFILIGVSAFVVEGLVFKNDVGAAAEAVFGRGWLNIKQSILARLDRKIFLRYMKKEYDKNFEQTLHSLIDPDKRFSLTLPTKPPVPERQNDEDWPDYWARTREYRAALIKYEKEYHVYLEKREQALTALQEKNSKWLFESFATKNQDALLYEFEKKSLLLGIAVILAIGSGLLFTALSYQGYLFLLGSSAIPTVWLLAFSAIAAVAYAGLMYWMLATAIENFTWESFGQALIELIEPMRPKTECSSDEWDKLSFLDKWKKLKAHEVIGNVLVLLLKVAILLSVIVVAVFVNIASGGTNIQTTAKTLKEAHVSLTMATSLSQALVYGCYLPVSTMFSTVNCLESAKRIIAILTALAIVILKGIYNLFTSPRDTYNKVAKSISGFFEDSPGNIVFKLLASLFAILLFCFLSVHALGEGFANGYGSIDPQDSLSEMISTAATQMSEAFKTSISPQALSVATNTFEEWGTDLTFVLASMSSTSKETDSQDEEGGDHENGMSYSDILTRFELADKVRSTGGSVREVFMALLFAELPDTTKEPVVTQKPLSLNDQAFPLRCGGGSA